MQQRRGTAAQWTAANPVLAAGEIGFETDTSKFKMGNGSSNWAALTYFANAAELASIIDGAPDLLNTLNELAAAIGDDPNFLTNYATIGETETAIADSRATSAIDATNKANAAQSAAEATASADATAKADAAESAAISTAAADATTKADAAEAAAVGTAAADTIVKANAAQAAAEASAIAHGEADATAKADAAQAAAEVNAASHSDAALASHNQNELNVHGIANTGDLALKSEVSAQAIGLGDVDNTSDANKPVSTAQATAISTAVSDHNVDTTNVHGIADTSVLATETTVGTAVSNAVAALTKSSVGLANVDNTADTAKPVSTATQTELDLKAPLADPTFTGTVVLPAVTAGGSMIPTTDNTYDLGSPTNMWKDIYVGPGSLYVNGQKVLQDESGAIVVSADIDENLGLRTSGSGNIELDPTGTGSVNIKGPLVVEAGANFSSADGNGIAFSNGIKSDSISSKTTDTDLSLSGNGTGKVYLNDNAEVNGNLVVTGNFTVSGTTTSVNTETISLADNIIDLNSDFTTGTPTENSGIRVVRGDSNAVQVRWNESTDKWEFTNDGTTYSPMASNDSPTFTGTVTIPAGASISGYAPISSPTFTGAVTVAESGVVFTDGTQTKAGVPSITTIPTELSANTAIAAGDEDKFIPLTGAVEITLPATGYVTGQSIDFFQSSGTGAEFLATNGVVGTPGLKFRTTYSVVTAMKISGGWLVFGDLSA